MTQTDNSFIQGRPSSGTERSGALLSSTARFAWIILLLATLYLCYFHNLGAVGFLGPDEPRYASIARDMAQSGDWVTPRLNGKPWFEKPVLYYWGAAASFKLFGVNEAAARLPSAFAALLATLSMAWLAWRIYGAETARWLLLLLPTTVGMIGFSHAAATDMPFSGILTVALVFAAVIVGLTRSNDSPILPHTPWLALLLFGFSLGLAVLAKGPAGVILSGSAVVLWAAFTKRWRDAFRCLHPVAIASFCLTAVPWYVLCARRNPDFFHIFIVEHNFKRFLTPEFQHLQPFWYYIPILLLALFPWTILFLASIRKVVNIRRETPETFPALLFFFSWALFTMLFFSISKSKLPGYILPAVPAIVILLARFVVEMVRENKVSSRWILLASGVALILLGIVVEHSSGKLPVMECVSLICGVTRIWLIAITGGAVIGLFGFCRQLRFSVLAIVLTTLLLVIEVDRFLPNLDPGVSARDAATDVKNVWPQFSSQRAAAWQLNRSYIYQLDYYLHADIPEWKPGVEKPDWLFVRKEKRQEAVQQGFECVKYALYPAVVPCRKLDSLAGFTGLDGFSGSHRSRDLANGQAR